MATAILRQSTSRVAIGATVWGQSGDDNLHHGRLVTCGRGSSQVRERGFLAASLPNLPSVPNRRRTSATLKLGVRLATLKLGVRPVALKLGLRSVSGHPKRHVSKPTESTQAVGFSLRAAGMSASASASASLRCRAPEAICWTTSTTAIITTTSSSSSSSSSYSWSRSCQPLPARRAPTSCSQIVHDPATTKTVTSPCRRSSNSSFLSTCFIGLRVPRRETRCSKSIMTPPGPPPLWKKSSAVRPRADSAVQQTLSPPDVESETTTTTTTISTATRVPRVEHEGTVTTEDALPSPSPSPSSLSSSSSSRSALLIDPNTVTVGPSSITETSSSSSSSASPPPSSSPFSSSSSSSFSSSSSSSPTSMLSDSEIPTRPEPSPTSPSSASESELLLSGSDLAKDKYYAEATKTMSMEDRVFESVVRRAARLGARGRYSYNLSPPPLPSPAASAAANISFWQLEAAYRRCGRICADFAKTFYLGTTLMTEERRRAIWAIYVWCRRTDELVDGPIESQATPAELDRWERRLEDLFAGKPYDILDAALTDTISAFPLDIQPFKDMIEGMRMDLTKSRYHNFDELYLYCYNVAGTVAIMTIPVMGIDRDSTASTENVYAAAMALGIANQLTNILRDVGEDMRRGRIYVPLDELEDSGIHEREIRHGLVTERWRKFMQFQIQRARGYFDKAESGVGELSKASRLPVWASLVIYRQILDKIEDNQYDNFTKRAFVGDWQKGSSLLEAFVRSQAPPSNRYGTRLMKWFR